MLNDLPDTTLPVSAPLPAETLHAHALSLARVASEASPDPSTKVGCVLVAQLPDETSHSSSLHVLGSGHNRFPVGMSVTPERLNNRPDKYMYTVHAEDVAIHSYLRNLLAGGRAVPIAQVTAYIWGMSPCTECLKGLADVGIRTVFYHTADAGPDACARYAITEASQTVINETGMRVVDLTHLVVHRSSAVSASVVTGALRP